MRTSVDRRAALLPTPTGPGAGPGPLLADRLKAVRATSERLITPLEPEDLVLQGMADASPPKWHLAHTTWFFEEFLLARADVARLIPDHGGPEPGWSYLFNSYYDAVGPRHPRAERGLLSRPSIGAVLAWRQRVDRALAQLLDHLPSPGRDRRAASPSDPDWEKDWKTDWEAVAGLIELGLQHEQQHQELLLMDLLDGFSRHPLDPVYRLDPEGPEELFQARARAIGSPLRWLDWRGELGQGALVSLGLDGCRSMGQSFHFDNEGPHHRVWLEPFAIASRLVSNADYEAFISDGGYRRPELWMSEGWALLRDRGWRAPRYWREGGQEFSLAGLQPRHPAAPVRHLSWFEADAYARWAGARLPTEAEWEVAQAHFGLALEQVFGLLWQWTSSPYRPYPGFRPAAGAVGEYNGKFMTSQFVLRGSAYLTPDGHERPTYRNFFPPASRWLAGGLRLARDGGATEPSASGEGA
jgi:ergothioneine biosynthesis protein EgtB